MATGDLIDKTLIGSSLRNIYTSEWLGSNSNVWMYFMANVARITFWLWQNWEWNNFSNDAHMQGTVQAWNPDTQAWEQIWTAHKQLHSNHGWGGYQVMINNSQFYNYNKWALSNAGSFSLDSKKCILRVKNYIYGTSPGGGIYIAIGNIGGHTNYDEVLKGRLIRRTPAIVKISNSAEFANNPFSQEYANTQQYRGNYIVESDLQNLVVSDYLDNL